MLRSVATAAVGSLVLAAAASAATIDVTSADDPGDGSLCTLRDAITAANTDTATGACAAGAGPDVISISLAGQNDISLASPLPAIGTSVQINGSGADDLTVGYAAAAADPVFLISSAGATVTLSGMTISNGSQGVVNSGTLTLQSVTVSGNSLTVTGDSPVATGAGVDSATGSDLTISDSTISGNSVQATADSGFALAQGAAIQTAGPLHMDQSTVSGNTATATAGPDGGFAVGVAAIATEDVASTISRSTITGNTVTSNSTGASVVNGAGIENGVNGSFKSMTLDRDTVTGNVASGGSTSGGGLFINGGNAGASVTGSTIDGNTAQSGGNVAASTLQNITFKDTIIADPISANDNCEMETSGGAFTSLGFNLDSGPLGSPSSTTTCLRTGTTGDQANANPALGPLQDNGGPTQTMAPGPGSPAIDQGIAAGATTDQRGFPRPFEYDSADASGGDGSDIGAFEASIAVDPPSIDFGGQKWGTTSSAQGVQLTNHTGNSLDVHQAALGGTDAGEFGSPGDACSNTTLANNDSCGINLDFEPTLPSIGARSATLTIPTDFIPSTMIDLSGTSTEYVSLLPAPHDFGSTQAGTPTGAFEFVATNLGPGTSGTLSAAVTGANASEFSITQDQCTAQTLPSGNSCSVFVRFAPTSAGAKSASLDLTGSPGGVSSSALTGSATSAPPGPTPPGPSPPGTNPSGPTGKRAAALKKCKKKHSKKAKKKCKRKAAKLPS